MNTKEMEALVIKQGEYLQAAKQAITALEEGRRVDNEAHMHLVQRADNIVEEFKKELAARDEVIEALAAKVDEMRGHQDGMNDTLFGAVGRIETMEKFVLARNISAAMKRNMVDEDARRVLTGDVKDLSHKEAAETIGLTYAQVYSCRLEFTFKHVHKDLRDNVKGWKNPWAK